MVTRRDEDIPGYNLDPRDGPRNPLTGRPASESMSLLKSAASFTRAKSPESSSIPHDAPRPSLLVDTPARSSGAGGAGPSILSLKIEITGSIATPEELHIYGRVAGNVRAAALTICEGGQVRGDVVAESVVVNGVIEGRIFAQTVHLRAGAEVRGDITHSSLGIDSAAIFEGASRRSQDPMAEAQNAARPGTSN